MHIKIGTLTPSLDSEPVVGNVYSVSGGRGMAAGHMYVIASITEEGTCVCLTISRSGQIVGGTQYGRSYMRERCPIAYVEGLDNLELMMRSL